MTLKWTMIDAVTSFLKICEECTHAKQLLRTSIQSAIRPGVGCARESTTQVFVFAFGSCWGVWKFQLIFRDFVLTTNIQRLQ